MFRAKINPEQAASRSKAPALLAPRRSCTRQAVAGKMCSGDRGRDDDQIQVGRASSGPYPEHAGRLRHAREAVVCSSLAMRRSRIPVCGSIHSSLVSMRLDSSSLVSNPWRYCHPPAGDMGVGAHRSGLLRRGCAAGSGVYLPRMMAALCPPKPKELDITAFNRGGPCLVGHVIQVAVRVGGLVIDRWGQNSRPGAP